MTLVFTLLAGRMAGDVTPEQVWPVSPGPLVLIVAVGSLVSAVFTRSPPLSALLPESRLRFAIQAVVLLVCLPLTRFWRLFSPDAADRLCLGMDIHGLFYPLRDWLARHLANGSLPLWTDQLLGGYPLLANPNTAAFYPVHWLLVFCLVDGHVPYGTVEALVLLHLSLAGLGTVYLARVFGVARGPALFAGAAMTLSGTLNAHAVHLNVVESFAWMTLVWADGLRSIAERRWQPALRAALWLGISLLCAHFQVVALGFCALVPLALVFGWQRGAPWLDCAVRLALTLVIGLGVGMAQVLPALAISTESERAVRAHQYATMGSLALPRLLGLLLPALEPADDRESVLYPGVLVLVLGAAALVRRCALRWTLGGLALAAFLFALGGHGALYEAVLAVAHPLKALRVPARAMLVAALAWVLLAAMALADREDETRQRATRWLRALAGVGLVVLISTWSGLLLYGDRVAPLRRMAEASAQLTLIAGLGAVLLTCQASLARPMTHALCCLLLVMDLAAPRLVIDTTPRENALLSYENRPALAALSRAQAQARMSAPFRVACVGLPGNAGLFYELDASTGWSEVEHLGRKVLQGQLGDAAFWRMEGVRYLIHYEPQPDMRVVWREDPLVLLEDPQTWPLAWLAGEAEIVDREHAIVAEKGPALRHRPLLELIDGGDAPVLSLHAIQGTLVWKEWGDGRRAWTCELPAPGLLVTTVPLLPGWRATVDSQPARLLRANLAYAAVPLDEGSHTVVLQYHLPGWREGLCITGCTMVLLAAMSLWLR